MYFILIFSSTVWHGAVLPHKGFASVVLKDRSNWNSSQRMGSVEFPSGIIEGGPGVPRDLKGGASKICMCVCFCLCIDTVMAETSLGNWFLYPTVMGLSLGIKIAGWRAQ